MDELKMTELIKKYINLYSEERKEELEKKWKERILKVNSFKEIIDCDDLDSLKDKIHINLYPVPYMGDLRRAKWYLLANNPGFEYMEYKEQQANADYKQALIDNLCQNNLENRDFPCVWLDPEYSLASVFQYWAKRLCGGEGKITKSRLKYLSKNVAIIQLFGYYSKSQFYLKDNLFREYKELSYELVSHLLTENKKIAIARNKSGWIDALENNKAILRAIEKSENKIRTRKIFIPEELVKEVNNIFI